MARVFFGDTLIIEAEAILVRIGLPVFDRAVQMAVGSPEAELRPKDFLNAHRRAATRLHVKAISIFKAPRARLAGDLGMISGKSGIIVFVGGLALKTPGCSMPLMSPQSARVAASPRQEPR